MNVCLFVLFCYLELHSEWEDKENVVEFDFLGKDSVRYWNFVPVEKKVREINFPLISVTLVLHFYGGKKIFLQG